MYTKHEWDYIREVLGVHRITAPQSFLKSEDRACEKGRISGNAKSDWAIVRPLNLHFEEKEVLEKIMLALKCTEYLELEEGVYSMKSLSSSSYTFSKLLVFGSSAFESLFPESSWTSYLLKPQRKYDKSLLCVYSLKELIGESQEVKVRKAQVWKQLKSFCKGGSHKDA